jgi:hypothetical protein
MATYINDFISIHTQILWEAQLDEFGRTVNYWPGGDIAQAIPLELIWIEGTEDEEISPGRYSHAHIRNADLPVGPALGDALEKDGGIFDVVRVNAYAYYFATIILQERG